MLRSSRILIARGNRIVYPIWYKSIFQKMRSLRQSISGLFQLPVGMISAALILTMNELQENKSLNASLYRFEKRHLLLRVQVNVSFILLASLCRLQEGRWVFGVPGLPRFASYPYIVGKRQSCSDANKTAVSDATKVSVYYGENRGVAYLGSSSSSYSRRSSNTAHTRVETPPER